MLSISFRRVLVFLGTKDKFATEARQISFCVSGPVDRRSFEKMGGHLASLLGFRSLLVSLFELHPFWATRVVSCWRFGMLGGT